MELHDLGVTMLRNSDVKFTPKTPWISPKNSPGENPWEKTMEKHGEFTGKSMGMKHDEAEVAGCFFFFPALSEAISRWEHIGISGKNVGIWTQPIWGVEIWH